MRKSLIRPLVEGLAPYVPGEQLITKGLIRLNTNENPYSPAPAVLEKIKEAVDGRLRRYPNPGADGLREKLAALHGCKKENILVGNGSDEVLELAIRAFVEPAGKDIEAGERSGSTVQYFWPSYSLYPVLADSAGALRNPVPLLPDFGIASAEQLKSEGKWDFEAALSFVTTPNAPTGRGYKTAELEKLCAVQKGVILLDEAYAEFADENAMELALEMPHVLVARTFSKAYSLCFQRVGYVIGSEELIGALHKIRGSYNVNGLGQVAAEATLENLEYYQKNFERVKNTRSEMRLWFAMHGFLTYPSQANFVFVKPPLLSAQEWYQRLREEKILVRWWADEEVKDYLRISIGSEEEMQRFCEVAENILMNHSNTSEKNGI